MQHPESLPQVTFRPVRSVRRVAALAAVIAAALVACSPQSEPAAPAAQPAKPEPPPPQTPFNPDETVADVMQYVVMPNAQIIWDSVAITVTRDGVDRSEPKTDEDWMRVRGAAITLAEVSNALMIPGRNTDVPGTPSDAPGDELAPDDIQKLRLENWDAWVGHLEVLHSTVAEVLDSIDKRDTDELMNAGGPIDEACENCHLQFWYPPNETGDQAGGQADAQ